MKKKKSAWQQVPTITTTPLTLDEAKVIAERFAKLAISGADIHARRAQAIQTVKECDASLAAVGQEMKDLSPHVERGLAMFN